MYLCWYQARGEVYPSPNCFKVDLGDRCPIWSVTNAMRYTWHADYSGNQECAMWHRFHNIESLDNRCLFTKTNALFVLMLFIAPIHSSIPANQQLATSQTLYLIVDRSFASPRWSSLRSLEVNTRLGVNSNSFTFGLALSAIPSLEDFKMPGIKQQFLSPFVCLCFLWFDAF